jgi:hypothetical protein
MATALIQCSAFDGQPHVVFELKVIDVAPRSSAAENTPDRNAS